MKTHFKKMQDPNYLGSWDLMDDNGNVKDVTLTIKCVEKRKVFDGKGGSEDLPVLVFTDVKIKPMVMNATNLKAVAKVTGSNFIEDWSGFKVKITVKKVKAFGDVHDALRISEEIVTLPELNPQHARWEGAKTALKAGNVTVEQIRKTYKLTEANEKLLLS